MTDKDPTRTTPKGLDGLAKLAAEQGGRGLPPVHLWHPVHCGEIDIVIQADGIWMHEGTPIGRPELTRLFSTVLRKDPDGYHLVTPVEKLKIRVEDLPFRAITLKDVEGHLVFDTDQGDTVIAGAEHPIVVETDPVTQEPAPRLHVRADLWARISRSLFYELVERATPVEGRLSVRSGEAVFALGPVGAGVE